MFEHFIFDFDGVLADSFQIACEEINVLATHAFPELPIVRDQEDMAFLYSGALRTTLGRFGLSAYESKCFFDLHAAAMRRRAASIKPFSDVLAAIARFAPRRCSIVTSSYSDVVGHVLGKSHYVSESLFRVIVGREQQLPKNEKIIRVLDLLKVNPKNALHVADMASDILYSRAVPIPICAVGWGYQPLSYLQNFNPDYFVASPDEFAAFLSSQTQPTTASAHEAIQTRRTLL